MFYPPIDEMKCHIKPLMITVMVEGEILVEGGACINILPVTKLKHFKKKVEDLLPHNIMVSNFSGNSSNTHGVVALDVTIESHRRLIIFMAISSQANFNMLLGHEWMQFRLQLFFWNKERHLTLSSYFAQMLTYIAEKMVVTNVAEKMENSRSTLTNLALNKVSYVAQFASSSRSIHPTLLKVG